MLPLIPRQDGDEITIPTDNEGVDKFKTVIEAMFTSQYFWGIVVIIAIVWMCAWAWKAYPPLRYATMIILGMAIGNFFPVMDIFK